MNQHCPEVFSFCFEKMCECERPEDRNVNYEIPPSATRDTLKRYENNIVTQSEWNTQFDCQITWCGNPWMPLKNASVKSLSQMIVNPKQTLKTLITTFHMFSLNFSSLEVSLQDLRFRHHLSTSRWFVSSFLAISGNFFKLIFGMFL